MKKLLILTTTLSLNISANAQAKIAIGLKGGLNYSKVDVSNLSSSGKTGVHGGAFALFRFAKIGIQPELILSQQGSKVDFDNLESNYINIPVILKIYLAAGVNLQVGPQFGFLNKAELDNQDVKDLLKKSDISAGLGFGWDAPFGLILDARYNLGLTDNNNDLYNETIKNQVIQVSIGFKIIKFGEK